MHTILAQVSMTYALAKRDALSTQVAQSARWRAVSLAVFGAA